jgi:GTP-binding protein Era
MTDQEKSRCGYVAIVGRPNVGKSTLLNRLVGQKISITSRKPQTTRHSILGIHTAGLVQTVYVDTPGLHLDAKRALNRQLNKSASSALSDVDLVIFVVDSLKWTEDDEHVMEKLKNLKCPVILVLNKIDIIDNKERLLPKLEEMNKLFPFVSCIPLSAKKNRQIDALQKEVERYLPEGPFCFEEDQVTDRSIKFLAAEIIREKLFRILGQEIPYAIAVQIESYQEEGNITHIHAIIWVEKESQKAIVIGKGGLNLKNVGQQARHEIEMNLETQVNLKLWVKVREHWADDQQALRDLGYEA